MIDKKYLKDQIVEFFPDLENTKFRINNTIVSSFTEQLLLPFLIYQNTVDIFNRSIGLYLPRNSTISNLIPFYVVISQYRKALDNLITSKGFKSQSFKPNEKLLNFNGSICSITTVDFINRQIVFQSGRGVSTTLSFFNTYNIIWQNSSLDIKQKIESLELIDKSSNGNIFTYPISTKENKIEGVIVFTNTTKFESLLRNVKVSGTDLREHINIQKVDFSSRDGSIKFKSLSKPSTRNKPISLLVARHDSFRAYESIISAGGMQLKNVKTVIIDNFDELIDRWERIDNVESEMNDLKHIYFEKVKSGNIKDIYIVSKNNSTYIHEIFKKNEIKYFPWLLKPVEEKVINSNSELVNKPSIIISTVKDEKFDIINSKLNQLIAEWKILAHNSFCSGEILIPITFLIELRLKINSFFDPSLFLSSIEAFHIKINQIKSRWFNEGQDYNKVNETIQFLIENFKTLSDESNYKLKLLIKKLKGSNEKTNLIIVSDNKSIEDINWMTTYLNSIFPDKSIIHFFRKEFLISKQELKYDNTSIVYLTSNKKIIGDTINNLLAEEQIFILNKSLFSFTNAFIKRLQNIQNDIASDEKKYELLNIEKSINIQNTFSDDSYPIIYDNQMDTSSKVDNNNIENSEIDIQSIVEEIIVNDHFEFQRNLINQHILFFDDGTILEVPETRHFFIYEDDKESDDIDKSQKTAKNLEVGSQIITTKRGLDVKDLLKQELKKNEHFSYLVGMDDKWRLLINFYISRNKMDLDYFCLKLAKTDFKIGAAALKHWIEGDTRRPDNFKVLLESLAELGIINIVEIDDYDYCNSELKSIQIKFVRTALKRLIDRFNGIISEEDELFTDDLMNDFINHIEIKRVTANYKI